VKYKKAKKYGCSTSKIDTEVLQHHKTDWTVIFWGPECGLDLDEKREAKKVKHSKNRLPQVRCTMIQQSQRLPGGIPIPGYLQGLKSHQNNQREIYGANSDQCEKQ
jgi:hypothetical protein